MYDTLIRHNNFNLLVVYYFIITKIQVCPNPFQFLSTVAGRYDRITTKTFYNKL